MGCKDYFFILTLFCLAGCAAYSSGHKQMYQQGYRAGVKEQMRGIAAQFQGGRFPYYHWANPLVQDVRVPAHISNGVFIPAHKELVIIKPGEWAENPAYPIESSKEAYERTTNDMPMDPVDITHLPIGNGASGYAQCTGKNADTESGMGGAK